MIPGRSGDLFSSASIPIFRRKSCKTPCRVRLDRNEKVLVTFEMEGCEKAVATVYPIRAEAPGAGVILGSVIEGPDRLKPATGEHWLGQGRQYSAEPADNTQACVSGAQGSFKV